jgi:hypothetical protein
MLSVRIIGTTLATALLMCFLVRGTADCEAVERLALTIGIECFSVQLSRSSGIALRE